MQTIPGCHKYKHRARYTIEKTSQITVSHKEEVLAENLRHSEGAACFWWRCVCVRRLTGFTIYLFYKCPLANVCVERRSSICHQHTHPSYSGPSGIPKPARALAGLISVSEDKRCSCQRSKRSSFTRGIPPWSAGFLWSTKQHSGSNPEPWFKREIRRMMIWVCFCHQLSVHIPTPFKCLKHWETGLGSVQFIWPVF